MERRFADANRAHRSGQVPADLLAISSIWMYRTEHGDLWSRTRTEQAAEKVSAACSLSLISPRSGGEG